MDAAIRYVQQSLNDYHNAGLDEDGVWGQRTKQAFDAAMSALPGGLASASSIVDKQHKTSRYIAEIIIHCTATPEGREVSVAEIDAWHRQRGFDGIGYHYVVHLDGAIEAGRTEDRVGAHVTGHNTGSIGIVYVGGVEIDALTPKDTRTPAQRKSLQALCRALIVKYPAITKISGHNEYAAKACPCFDVQSDPLGALV